MKNLKNYDSRLKDREQRLRSRRHYGSTHINRVLSNLRTPRDLREFFIELYNDDRQDILFDIIFVLCEERPEFYITLTEELSKFYNNKKELI